MAITINYRIVQYLGLIRQSLHTESTQASSSRASFIEQNLHANVNKALEPSYHTPVVEQSLHTDANQVSSY